MWDEELCSSKASFDRSHHDHRPAAKTDDSTFQGKMRSRLFGFSAIDIRREQNILYIDYQYIKTVDLTGPWTYPGHSTGVRLELWQQRWVS